MYFVIGLTIVLFLTWRALEYKTYPKDEVVLDLVQAVDDLKEDAPVTEMIKTPPPPPPPAAPEVIEVVEDTEEIEETIIESTETSQDAVVDEVIEVDDVEVGEEEEEITVPFAIIENVPVFPGCESAKNNEERKLCFQEKIQEHIIKEFTYPPAALELGIQGRVFIQFVIDSKGNIGSIRMRGPDKNLEKEAHRIVASLPRMTPGSQRGKAVSVPYSIPINFIIQ
ncbi:energy transducer TonB [Muriicola soli]|uniref:Energy transducer TonB n=1 Tax=Muriicola soli TaxID=2507538 RepID=A0A411EBG9_9FLAO|nr:energy transducer TonB [Muriicola soli]